MKTRVVGVTFSNEDGSNRARIIAGMTESDNICLERDPYNQYDANAVKVCVLKNGEKKQIGFLAKEIATEVSPKLRHNFCFDVKITGVGTWNDRPFCEIEIIEKTVSSNTTSSYESNSIVPNSKTPNFTPTFKPINKTSASSEDNSTLVRSSIPVKETKSSTSTVEDCDISSQSKLRQTMKQSLAANYKKLSEEWEEMSIWRKIKIGIQIGISIVLIIIILYCCINMH